MSLAAQIIILAFAITVFVEMFVAMASRGKVVLGAIAACLTAWGLGTLLTLVWLWL